MFSLFTTVGAVLTHQKKKDPDLMRYLSELVIGKNCCVVKTVQ